MPWQILVSAREDKVASMQILPTITSITPSGAWRDKVKEVKRLKLKDVALFPTCLEPDERKELYQLLKETNVKSIPFVHLRNDMAIEELDYLVQNYQTKIFNTHTQREFPFLYDYAKYKNVIYIENVYEPLDEEEIKEFAGVCLDISHLETDRILNLAQYEHNIKIIDKYGCGCSHLSALKKEPFRDIKNVLRYDSHHLENLSELDYLKRYPLKYFSHLVAVELENTIEEQLKVIKYLKKKILKRR